MGDRAQIMSSFGGRQGPDSEQIEQSFGGGGNGYTPPALTLTGPLTYATNAIAGTLVANISNVPTGAAPTISPNDGRLVVAGNATAGWTVVTGLSASSVGSIPLTVSASGATSVSQSIPVTLRVFAIHPRGVFEGDSIEVSPTLGFPLIESLNALSNGKARLPIGYQKGVSGNRVPDVLGRVPAVIAMNPSFVHLHIGTNDLGQSSDTPTTIFNNIVSCINPTNGYLSASACRVVFIDTVLPRFGGQALSTARETDRQTLNQMLRGLATYNIVICDHDTLSLSGADFQDGLHLNHQGSVKVGQNIANAMAPFFDPTDMLALSRSAPYWSNATFASQQAATGTGISGTIATGVSASFITASGLNVVCSMVDRGDGSFAQRFQVSGTNTANGRFVVGFPGLTRTIPAGGCEDMWVGFSLVAGAVGLSVIDLSANASYNVSPGRTPQYAVLINTAYSGVIRTGIVQSYASATTGGAYGIVEMFMPSGTVNFDIQFYLPGGVVVPASAV
jgi:lysophospholipase L1-like esterase